MFYLYKWWIWVVYKAKYKLQQPDLFRSYLSSCWELFHLQYMERDNSPLAGGLFLPLLYILSSKPLLRSGRGRTLECESFSALPPFKKIIFHNHHIVSHLFRSVGPESDHCLALSNTKPTDWCFRDLVDVTLANAFSKVVDVVADVKNDVKGSVGNTLTTSVSQFGSRFRYYLKAYL